MGSEALRAAIEAEGRARVAAILHGAEREARRLRDEASSRAMQRRDEALRDAEVELRRTANARIASARSAARGDVLEARAAFIRRVLDGAGEALLSELRDPGAEVPMVGRAEQSLAHMPPDDPIVFACSRDVAPLLEAALAGRAGVRVECDPTLPGGFRATGAKGAMVIDATIPSLLETDREMLAIEILRRFDAGEAGGA